MSILFWIELVIMLACIFIGARFNGVGLGIWGGVGLFLLSVSLALHQPRHQLTFFSSSWAS